MRSKALLLLIALAGCLPAMAVEDTSPPPVVPRDRLAAAEVTHAASERAVASLYEQLADLPLAPRQTIGQFLNSLEVRDEFMKTLRRADQIGGPRWVNEYTAQVQLEISTARVSYALRQLAASYPKSTSITPAQIELAASQWPRSFLATGCGTSATAIVNLRPLRNPAWDKVPDADRKKALQAARIEATDKAMKAVSPVLLSDRKTLGDSFAVPEVKAAVQSWLENRPVTRVEFKDNLQVEVALGVDQRDYFNVVRTALSRQSTVPVPKEADGWRRVEQDFGTRYAAPVGMASVARKPAPVTKPAFQLPLRAPEWVDRQIEVSGEAKGPGPGPMLRTSVEAEAKARESLRSNIDSLPLTATTTVGDAAKDDPQVAAAVARTLKQAQIVKVDYRRDGGVTVRMFANMRDLWDNLRSR